MRFVRESSLQEYAVWYLHRDAAKSAACLASVLPEDAVQTMRASHSGKMRGWFNGGTRWQIVQLETVDELGNLVFLECDWTKEEMLVIPGTTDYRLLARVAANAITSRYMDRLTSDSRHRIYYDRLARSAMNLTGMDRIAVCSAELNEIESNPSASHYLLDGVGRCLPYMILIQVGKLAFGTVEAFLVERGEH